jgi:hypothetical protein
VFPERDVWGPSVHSLKFASRLRQVAAAVLFVLAQATAAAAADERGAPIAKKLAVDDIRLALSRAEAIHPKLFWYADRTKVLARAEALIAALPDPVRPMDVYLALAQITGMLNDGHVTVSRPPAPGGEEDLLKAYLQRGGAILMTAVVPVTSGLAVFASRADGIAKDDVIKRINGQDALALFERAKALEPGEPGLKRYFAALEFPLLLWDLGLRPPYKVEGVFGGVERRLELAGTTGRELDIDAAPEKRDSLAYEPLPGAIGLITFEHMTEPYDVFGDKLAKLFKRIARERPRGLIIDLRGNHGGDSALGDALLDYLSKKPRRPFAKMTVRASPECRDDYTAKHPNSYFAELLKRLPDGTSRTRSVPIETPEPNPLRYAGPVAVLIGPGTFSSANILANNIADFELATLVGRDTAEIANNYGMICGMTLPNTGIEMHVPGAYTVRANGDEASREPVHPHIAVPRPADRLPAEDLDVAAARKWLQAHFGPASAAPTTPQVSEQTTD